MADVGLELVSNRLSPFGQRVVIALEEKRLPYTFLGVDMFGQKSPLLLQVNPVNKQVPVLVHKGSKPLAESKIILEYIEELWPAGVDGGGQSLFSSTLCEKSQARFWGEYIDQALIQPMQKMVRAKETDEDRVMMEKALRNLEAAIGEFAGQEKPFFFGKQLGFVDIIFAPFIPWLTVASKMMGTQLPSPTEAPHLHDWMAALQQHPTIRPVITDPAVAEMVCLKLRSIFSPATTKQSTRQSIAQPIATAN